MYPQYFKAADNNYPYQYRFKDHDKARIWIDLNKPKHSDQRILDVLKCIATTEYNGSIPDYNDAIAELIKEKLGIK